VRGDFVVGWSDGGLSHHQHVEDDHRRKAKDYRPYPERPKHVFSGESLLLRENLVSREELLFSKHLVVVSEDLVSEDLVSEDLVSEDLVSEDLVSEDLVSEDHLSKHCILVVHDAPAFFFYARDDSRPILKSRSGFRLHLNAGATVN
jgi:hypothetical protein